MPCNSIVVHSLQITVGLLASEEHAASLELPVLTQPLLSVLRVSVHVTTVWTIVHTRAVYSIAHSTHRCLDLLLMLLVLELPVLVNVKNMQHWNSMLPVPGNIPSSIQ